MAPLVWTEESLSEPDHVFGAGWCWCQPRIEPMGMAHVSDGEVILFPTMTFHRHFWDRPEYDE